MRKYRKFRINKDTVYTILSLAVIIFAIFIFFKFNSVKECPDRIQGNVNASFKIKYFESPFCIYCWLEEPVLKSLLETRGNLFVLERYDVRYCHNETSKYGISGTPSFVFSMKNESGEYAHYGFIDKENLEKAICNITRGC